MTGTAHRVTRLRGTVVWPLVLLATLALAVTHASGATAKPVKEILSAHLGWEVNKNGGSTCSTAEEQEGKCQSGKSSNRIGGFEFPQGVTVNNDPASPLHGDLYVIDATHRVLVYTPAGQFVLMFGSHVNKTTGGDTCTAAEVSLSKECEPGATGTAPGQFNQLISIAIDPTNGDVYVAELVVEAGGFGDRVQEFTSEGAFVLELGRKVNQTTGGNICTANEEAKGAVCTGPAKQANQPTTEHDAFSFDGAGTALAVGGPESLLYVGEPGRVQILQRDGTFKREIPLQFITTLPNAEANHVAVDADGNVYLTYYQLYEEVNGKLQLRVEHSNTIYTFDDAGNPLAQLRPVPRLEGGRVEVEGLQIDPAGRLAALEVERVPTSEPPFFRIDARGSLYGAPAAGGLRLTSEFSVPAIANGTRGEGLNSLAFGEGGRLYASTEKPAGQEVVAYEPVTIGELTTLPFASSWCTVRASVETDATLGCTLHGEANAENVSATQVWFEWRYKGQESREQPPQPILTNETTVPVDSKPIEGLAPNAVLRYRLAGEDQLVKAPEELVGETLAARLPTVPPRVVGEPVAQFVGSFSADLSGQLNPENANSRYFFEYASGTQALSERCPHGITSESCPGVQRTATLQSAAYGKIGVTIEAAGLEPGTAYRYRLAARNEAGEPAVGETGGAGLPEGTFSTLPAATPQVSTGMAGQIGATTATISGLVNPGGQPAVYRFELGVYDPAGTQYGVVVSAPAGETSTFIPEQLALSGLQPGTTYAFRIALSSAYVPGPSHVLYGEPALFTTLGVPSVLSVVAPLAMLPFPSRMSFPAESHPVVVHIVKCKRGYERNKRGKCVKTKPKLHGIHAHRARSTRPKRISTHH